MFEFLLHFNEFVAHMCTKSDGNLFSMCNDLIKIFKNCTRLIGQRVLKHFDDSYAMYTHCFLTMSVFFWCVIFVCELLSTGCCQEHGDHNFSLPLQTLQILARTSTQKSLMIVSVKNCLFCALIAVRTSGEKCFWLAVFLLLDSEG